MNTETSTYKEGDRLRLFCLINFCYVMFKISLKRRIKTLLNFINFFLSKFSCNFKLVYKIFVDLVYNSKTFPYHNTLILFN